MKLIIEKVYDPIKDERFFCVKSIGEEYFCKHFCYKENVPKDDIYNEERNYNDALELALRLEKIGTSKELREIVYSTENIEQ